MSRLYELAHALQQVPVLDRYLALVGAAVAASTGYLEHLDGWLSRLVVIATLAMLIPRVILGCMDLSRARADRRRQRREDARRLIDEAASECEGCGAGDPPEG